jgi:tRNA-splicing ligase RtcB
MAYELISTGEATAILPTTDSNTKPITVIGTQAIRSTFDEGCLKQAVNSRLAPGVTDLVLNPDAHCGYGAPVGCVMVSPTHIYPGPVGVDIKCSMSLLQLSVPADEINDRQSSASTHQCDLRANSDRSWSRSAECSEVST